MSYKHILVPVDFSEYSYNALDYALFIAKKYDSKVTVLHVVALYGETFREEEQIEAVEEMIREHEKQRQQLLERSKQKTGGSGIETRTEMIRNISVPSGILEYASERDADLIVMGNHGNTGFKKFLLGSVSQRVLRLADIPVITVQKDWKSRKIDNVLIPVDFSEASRRSVGKAAFLLRDFNATPHLVHVIEQDEHPHFYNVSFQSILETNPELEERISANLKKLMPGSGSTPVISVLEGKAHSELDDYAEKHPIDLIVMSCRGHNLFENILIGSTTEKMVAMAPCPVLVIPD